MAKGPELEVAARQALDPATQRRQEHLFRQAEGYAAQQPFQQQYGYGRQMVPGLSGMSQTGQGYLTDKILGKGAYRIQNLGFQDHQRPSTAQPGGFQYGQSGYMPGQQFTPGYQTGRYRTGMAPEGGDGSMAWGGGGVPGTDPGGGEGDGGGDLSDAELAELGLDVQPGRRARQAQYGTTPYQGQGQADIDTVRGGSWQGETEAYTPLGPEGDPAAWTPWQQETWKTGAPSGMAGVNQPSYELNIFDTPDTPFGAQNLPTGPVYIEGLSRPWEESSAAQYAARGGDPTAEGYVPPTGGGLLQTDLGRPTAGVGIGEVEDARTATRRMLLEQGRTGGLDYDRFLPGVEGIREGQQRRNSLGELMWESPGVPYLYTADDAVEAVPAGWQGIAAPGYNQFLGGDWQGIAPAAGVNQFLGAGGWQGLAPAGTGTAPGDPSISTLGEQGITDPEAIGAEAIPGIGAQTIGAVGADAYGVGQDVAAGEISTPTGITIDPITGQTTTDVAGVTPATIAGPTDVTVDPLTGETTQDVAGVDPTAFTGASFLGGDLGAYMDVGGVDAQVSAAQLDFQRAQNEEQARRAQSLAWGTRGDIPRAEQETAMLARIAEIRRKGYTDAADRMESDLRRQQAAGMQSQQLAMQGGLQGQQLQAQRREADAARAQQAAMQGQQLGTQAALQTQQLGMGAGTRQAELGLQAQMQGQQLQAQRRESDAARAQQAALAGQQLGAEALMQEQRLGGAAGTREAELAFQADLANQQAALQSGSQTQQLGAQRAIRQAELDLQQQQAAAGVGADVALQQQQLEQQAGIRGAELEAQRQQRETELGLQRGMQTQQLGADAAAQQTQNEFLRRQALAGMGQDAATQQTQNEFARRQQLAQMGLTSAQQQSQNEFLRRQELSRMGLQAQGMGMDDQARFREQQMALAQQLGRQGLDEQAATFAAAQQLAQMGGTQEQRQQMQAAADYEQWLRSQEGFADEAAFLQAMQPTPGQTQYQRKPSVWGQIGGGLLAGAGVAAQAGAFGSDARIKDNIEYVGMENGFKTYEFNYLGRDNRYKGVMAQEVMVERPDAVEMQDGFYRVNYDAIGVQFEAV